MNEYVRPTHQQGIAAAQAIGEEFGITWNDLRRIATEHMHDTMPDLEEIGSSDVSCHLSSLGNYDPDFLREQAAQVAERNKLVADVAARTGKTEAETLDTLGRMFAPAD